MAPVGRTLLIIGLVVAGYGILASLYGVRTSQPQWVDSGRRSVYALAGLTQPVAALSFEFTTIQRDVARASIDRCMALGLTRFNAAIGESQTLGDWRTAESIGHWLDTLPHEANSGDVYALAP